MIAFLATFFGTLLALLAVGGVGIYLLTVWADADDLWPASRRCDNVDGGA